MSAKAPSPPRLSRVLLRWILPRADREGAIGELDEKFGVYAGGAMGRRRARAWYRRQVAGALHPGLWARPLGRRFATDPSSKGRTLMSFNLMHDIRFGIRMLVKTPATTAVIVLMLAVGLGFNGAIFSILNTIVLNDLPIEEADRVLFLDSANPSRGRDRLRMSYPDYLDLAAAARSFEFIAAWNGVSVNLSDGVEVPERFAGTAVEPAMFDVLRVQPALGRRLTDADSRPGAEPVALIGNGLWQTRYGADPEIIGRVVQIGGSPTTVVGVLPPEVERTPFNADIWTPIIPGERMQTDRGWRFLHSVGRLRSDGAAAGVAAEIERSAAALAAEHTETNEGVVAVVGTFNEMFTETGNKTIVLVMMGAVAFLLTIACANVANLLISRSVRRAREVVIRSALGASRLRLVRQLLIESLILSITAGVGATIIAVWGAGALERAIQGAAPPQYWDFSIRPGVFGFIFGLAAATSLVFGLAPALHATRGDVSEALKDGGRASGGTRARHLTGALVVAQVALSLVLLAGAGVMVRSTFNILDVDWSVDPDDVLTMRVSLPSATYPESADIVAFHDRLRERFSAVPAVEAVAHTALLPSDGGFTVSAELEGLPIGDGNPPVTLSQMIVSPQFFELAGVAAERGRLFDAADGLDEELVLVVERGMAERFWPDQNPIDRRLRWIGETETRWARVVGVVPDLNHAIDIDISEIHPVVYTPFAQEPLRTMAVLTRSPMDPQELAGLLRREAQEVDANLPLFDVATLETVVFERTVGWQIVSVLFGLLGAIALFLAAVGIYAVVAFAVGNRQREIGIRMALGARAGKILSMVARTSLGHVILGLGLGLVGALGLTRVIAMFMYEVSPTDSPTFATALAVLGLTALIAGLIPARRASRVDPVIALRSD